MATASVTILIAALFIVVAFLVVSAGTQTSGFSQRDRREVLWTALAAAFLVAVFAYTRFGAG